MSRSPKPDLSRMLALLEQEQKALRSADMDGLSRLRPRKEAILARLEAPVHSAEDTEALVRKVQQKASDNARLFEAALQGLRDARSLIERCTSRHDDRIYARDGVRRVIDPPHGSMERRA